MEQWAEGMDGKFGGPFLRMVFQPVKEAADRYRTARVDYRKRYTDKTDVTRDALETKFARIREQGYVFADEDLNNGVAVVSAPVFGPTGALSCTLSLGGAAQGFGPDRLDHIVTAVREACAALSERLGAPAPR